MADTTALIADLRAEGDTLDTLVAELPPSQWAAPTPAEGWTIAHQIAHLAWTDEAAIIAATDPEAFAVIVGRAAEDPAIVDIGAAEGAADDPESLLARWRRGRNRIADVLAGLPAGARLPWFGPPMGAASMATARLMETWAHGQDIADALDAVREPTHRLRHVAHIGVRTRDFSFLANGLTPPAEPVRVTLTAPSGDLWTWGPDDAPESVTGPALDFCLLVTQRRHRADLTLVANGDGADRWLDVAQAFAGPPGAGRTAGTGRPAA